MAILVIKILKIMYDIPFKNIIEYIFILGAGQGFLLSIFLFTKKENRLANRIFSIAMLAFSLDLLNTIYVIKQLYYDYPDFAGVTAMSPFIYVPSIYLYSYFLCNKKQTLKFKYLLNYIPFIIIFIYGFSTYFFESEEFKIAIYDNSTPKLFIQRFVQALIPFYGIIYTLLSIREIINYNNRLKENYSDIEKLKLDWLIYLISGIAIIWLFEFLQYIVLNILNYQESVLYIVIYVSLSVLIYSIAYLGLKQPDIFLEVSENEKMKEKKDSEDIQQYAKSGLDKDSASDYKQQLLNLMETEKPFLDSKLNLDDLANQLGISKHNLSEIINTTLNQTFYDFVNSYRINEVKRLIEEDKEISLNLFSIALDSGFNSKTTFNNTFKKICGLTPSQYRKYILSKS